MQECHEYQVLDTTYMEAWTHGNHAKVMEYRKKIEAHKATCPLCSNPAGIASALWPNLEVKIGTDNPTSA